MGRVTRQRLLFRLQRDHELQRLIAESGDGRRLRRRDRAQLALHLGPVFGLTQELHARRDRLDAEVWQETERVLAWLVLHAGVAAWWRESAETFAPDFRAAVESIRLRSTAPRPPAFA